MDLDNIEEYMDIFTHNHNAVKQPFALLDDDDDNDKFLSIAYDSESDSSLISSLKGINKEYRELVPKLITLFKLNTDDITKESKLSTIKNAFVNLFKSANAQRNDESHVGAFPLFLTLLKDLYEYLVQTCSLPRDHFGSIYNAFDAFWSFYSDLEIFDKTAVLNQPVMKDNWFQSLKIVSTFNHKYIDMISTIFCLNDERSRQDFLPYLVKICWDLLTVEHYLEKSVRWAIYFRLKPHLDKDENKVYLKEIVLQCCIFNNKVLFEEYIGDSVEDKKFVLRLLDGYMNMADYPGTRLKSTYVKPEYTPLEEKFLGEDNLGGRNKRLSHLVVSYLKKWDLSVDLIPKTMYHRAVDFIIFKHVMAEKEKTSDLNYEESLQHICEGRHDVQLFLLDHLIYRGINRQALIWAGLFKIPCEEWPAELRFYVNRNPEKLVEVTKYIQLKRINEEQLKKQRNLVFYLFEPVDEEPYKVYTIDNKGYLEAAIKEIEKSEGEGGLIGVDCEWKPPGIMINEELALIQIACHAAIFLIDIVELEKILAEDEWKAFFIRIFCNPKITKIGFDFRNDLRVMCNTFPFLREYKNVIVDSTICLFNFCNKIVAHPDAFKAVFPECETEPKMNLESLIEKILKVPLDKGEQIGNWAYRPLRLEQKKYAAMDAYCLIELYYKIEDLLESVGYEIMKSLIEDSKIRYEEKVYGQPTQPRKKGEPRENNNISSQQIREVVAKIREELEPEMGKDPGIRIAHEVEICTDNMLNNVGKILRKCGIKAKTVAERNELRKYCALNKNCQILTTGRPTMMLTTLFPGRTFGVHSNLPNESPKVQIEYVLRLLKIIVKDEDLFSLCLKCNNKGFMRLPLPLVKFLFIQNARKKGIDFLAYTKDDEKTAWKELLNYKPEEYDRICCKIKISSLDENDKTKWITARLSDGLIDISTKLLNGDRAPYGPVKLNLSNFEVRRLFQHPGTIYHACYHCGRIDYHSDYPVDENKDANNNVKLSTPVPAESPRILTTVSATDYFALKNLIP